MNRKLVEDIVTYLEEHGIYVWGIAFDLGNKTLVSQLNLSPDNVSLINPFDASRSIYAFPDCPHLLKLSRNHLLDQGYEFVDDSGVKVFLHKKDFEKLLDKDSGELQIAFKVRRESHLECTGSSCQRVRTAAQMLSSTIAKAFMYVFGEEKKAQADVVQTVNDWFDVLNSSSISSKKKLSCGFGLHLEDQLHVLKKMETLVSQMKVIGRSGMLPFQSGILISIRSVRQLYKDVRRQNPDVEFLLTTHLNQDCIENLFSRVRAITGNNQHPTPVEALRRLRVLMLGKDHNIILKNPAVQDEQCLHTNTSDKTALSDEVTDEDNLREPSEPEFVTKMVTKDLTSQEKHDGFDEELSQEMKS